MAIDATFIPISPSKQNVKYFDRKYGKYTKEEIERRKELGISVGTCTAMLLALRNVTTQQVECFELFSCTVSEKSAVYGLLNKYIAKKPTDEKCVITFDRLYPSTELIAYLERNKLFYLMRLDSKTFIKEHASVRKDDFVNLELIYKRIYDFHDKALRQWAQEQISFSVRFAKYENDVSFITNLPKQSVPYKKLYRMYSLRWNIEIFFKDLKNKDKGAMKTINEKKPQTVLQTVIGAMILLNLAYFAKTLLDYELHIKNKKIFINLTTLTYRMKKLLTAIFLHNDFSSIERFKKRCMANTCHSNKGTHPKTSLR